MYTVYILYSPGFQKNYVGYTSDLQRRLEEHNVTATKGYSIRFRPWELLHKEDFEDKKAAMARERFYKSGVGREMIKEMIEVKYSHRTKKD